jgi:hypothetical protein
MMGRNMNWIGLLTVIFTAVSITFAFVRYREYEDEVQRNLYQSLVGRQYPQNPILEIDSQIKIRLVNLRVKRSRLFDWKTDIELKISIDEFPWQGEKLEDWDYDSVELETAAEKEGIETVEDRMEEVIYNFLNPDSRDIPEIRPEFKNKSYGTTLYLECEEKDMFFLTQQLELVTTGIPILFEAWELFVLGVEIDDINNNNRDLEATFPEVFKIIEEKEMLND